MKLKLLWDIFKFKRYVNKMVKNPIPADEIVGGDSDEAFGEMANLWEEFFVENPKAIFPKFLVSSVSETGDKLLALDFSGFHFDVGLRSAYELFQARLKGDDAYSSVDVYLTDLIDYFQFLDEDKFEIMPREACISIVRNLIATNGNRYLMLLAQQMVVTLNQVAIYSIKPKFDMQSQDHKASFINACRSHVYNELELEDLIDNWSSSFTQYYLHECMSSGYSERSIMDRGKVFEGDILSMYTLAKTFSAVDDDMPNPLDLIPDNQVEIVGGLGGDDDDLLRAAKMIKSSLKGLLAYMGLLNNLVCGYNKGALSRNEWKLVLYEFEEFRKHVANN